MCPAVGIVHRLDRDTSGIMVVARTLMAHHDLVAGCRRAPSAGSVRGLYPVP